MFLACQAYQGFLKVFLRHPTFFHSKGISFFDASSLMFEIECILDEASWELAACRISTIISLLGSKQIRLGVPKVPGPLHTGGVGFSERVTSLMEIHSNQKKIRDPSGHVGSFLNCFQAMADDTFLPKTVECPGIN